MNDDHFHSDLQSTLKYEASLKLSEKVTVHVEILQKTNSLSSRNELQSYVEKLMVGKKIIYEHERDTIVEFQHVPHLKEHVDSIRICGDGNDLDSSTKVLDCSKADIQFRIYQLNEDEPGCEQLDDDTTSAATHWILPSKEFCGTWENLIYDSSIKKQLLNFVSTTLIFSDHNVNNNIITWNKVVLLHGPPGTGKTSLCKALAQKLCIRLSHRYAYGQLVEINSHSLFSKWFSESGKLVQKMFEKIQEYLDDENALVFVLIDEVESLARARHSVMGGADPSDAVRAVNALLTQIDAIKRYPNVIILTTSNVTEAVDLALVDRADIKQYIGLPSVAAITRIYESCVKELLRVGIIKLTQNEQNEIQVTCSTPTGVMQKLQEVSEQSVGLSGRTLRKLPFLAHALFVNEGQNEMTSLMDFLVALSKTVTKQFQERQDLEKK